VAPTRSISPSKKARSARRLSWPRCSESSRQCTTSRLRRLGETEAFRALVQRQLMKQPDFVWTGPGQVRKAITPGSFASRSRELGSRTRTVRRRPISSNFFRPTGRIDVLALITNRPPEPPSTSRPGGSVNSKREGFELLGVSISSPEAAKTLMGTIRRGPPCTTGHESPKDSPANTTNIWSPVTARHDDEMRSKSKGKQREIRGRNFTTSCWHANS